MKRTAASTMSEIANVTQGLLGLASQLRHSLSTDSDLAVRLESEVARLARAVRRLQPKKERSR